jgi:hypothetical protein
MAFICLRRLVRLLTVKTLSGSWRGDANQKRKSLSADKLYRRSVEFLTPVPAIRQLGAFLISRLMRKEYPTNAKMAK